MENQTIIVKKIKKGGHGHHGGAWKVAFADFAVAMMAFFLLLWLIASATPVQKKEMSEYFIDPIQHAKAKKATDSMIDAGGVKSTSKEKAGQDFKTGADQASEAEMQKAINQDKERLRDLMEEIREAIKDNPDLSKYKDQLKLDITPEGLSIQIIDKENRAMFDSGSAELKGYTKIILHELAKTINKVPNRVSLSGHTDAARFVGRENYSNWELSADRANASRRELIAGGLLNAKMAKVVGLASMVPFDTANPRSARNRRIAIVVMNKEAEAALFNEDQSTSSEGDAKPKGTPPPVAAPVKLKPVPAKPAPAVKPKPVVKPKPKRSSLKADLPPARKGEKQFINVPPPIVPISPIKLKSSPAPKARSAPKTAPARKAKPAVKAKAKPALKKAPRREAPPPGKTEEKQFISVPPPIAPINPIQLPGQ